MGFYGPAQLVADARAHDVEIRSVDINFSDWETTIETRAGDQKLAVRLGFSMIKGLSSSAADTVVRARETGAFNTYGDFVVRTQLSNAVLARLAAADAFGSLELTRRPALWKSLAVAPSLPLFAGLADDDPAPSLPPLSAPEEVVLDYYSQGLSLRGHPLSSLRESLSPLNVVPAAMLKELKPDRRYRVAGLVL